MKMQAFIKKVYAYRNFYSFLDFTNYYKLITSKEIFTEVTLKNGVRVKLRGGNILDLLMADSVFVKQYHVPPFILPENAVIVDLGSNIGFSIIDYKLKYPYSRILGVEMDHQNFKLCKTNTSSLPNCKVCNKAIWIHDCEVYYDSKANSDAYSIAKNESGKESLTKVDSISIKTLLSENDINTVDFMKIDIEGAEIEIFRSGDLDWLNAVKALHIEIHDKSYFEEIKEKVSAYNFNIIVDTKHWSAFFAWK